MKTIVVDPGGFILATAPTSVKPSGKGAPRGARMIPHSGQAAYELDIPAEVARLGAAELHRLYRVDLRGKPKLVRIETASPHGQSSAKT